MSVTHPDRSFDSGRNHLKPFVVAMVIVVVTAAITLVFSGLPH
ncbi:MAG TPA: hypothetical protein VMB73_24965 [Acetobacteraceae bacterium]|jgi:hypothetical protein|nr:hypothetical protein [Acetobacteraceae bacterium]